MTCAEFQVVLPDLLEGGGTAEQRAHLTHCSACSEFVSDINSISQQARQLRACEEPSPRIWNSIEIALRQEGLIREPGSMPLRTPVRSLRHWTLAWLLPATAAFLVTFGVLRHEHLAAPQPVAQQQPSAAPAASTVAAVSAPSQPAAAHDLNDDKQLLEVIRSRPPAVQASYERELQHVNEYIRDAERSVKAHPDDEEAQEYLMDAYQQKAMVYQLAMDRSLQ